MAGAAASLPAPASLVAPAGATGRPNRAARSRCFSPSVSFGSVAAAAAPPCCWACCCCSASGAAAAGSAAAAASPAGSSDAGAAAATSSGACRCQFKGMRQRCMAHANPLARCQRHGTGSFAACSARRRLHLCPHLCRLCRHGLLRCGLRRCRLASSALLIHHSGQARHQVVLDALGVLVPLGQFVPKFCNLRDVKMQLLVSAEACPAEGWEERP